MFVGLHEHRVVDAGHNLPQQAPQPFADAVLKVRAWFRMDPHRTPATLLLYAVLLFHQVIKLINLMAVHSFA